VKLLIPSILLLLTIPHFETLSQKQLVLLKRQDVLLRLYPGDEFVFKLKGSKTIRRSYVNNLLDTAVIAHHDTIPYHKIERVYFRQIKRYNLLGGAMVFAGTALFLIDQFNIVVVQGESASLDAGVSRMSLSGIVIGLPLLLIKKKSQRLNYKFRLMTVKKGSSFYQDDPKGFISPYIDN